MRSKRLPMEPYAATRLHERDPYRTTNGGEFYVGMEGQIWQWSGRIGQVTRVSSGEEAISWVRKHCCQEDMRSALAQATAGATSKYKTLPIPRGGDDRDKEPEEFENPIAASF